MPIQPSPNAWSCLPTSCATAVGASVRDFINHIGHDGSEVIWPELAEPSRRRGFHIQECIDILLRAGFAVTPIEVLPRLAPAFSVPSFTVLYQDSEEAAFSRFSDFVYRGRGVITGYASTVGHAVAYDHGEIFDCRWPHSYRYHRKASEAFGFIGYCAWQINTIQP